MVDTSSTMTLEQRKALAVAKARRARAEQLLAGNAPIEAIARQLGYAETASFTHAFIRWTGMRPSEFRRHLRTT